MSNHRSGMTLLETLVWVAVLILICAAICDSLIFFYKTNENSINDSDATISAQNGIDTMVRTIREAAYSASGAYPIVSIAPNEMVFYANVVSTSSIEKADYAVVGGSLIQGLVEPAGDPPVYAGAEASSTLSTNVQNIQQSVAAFTYYDQNGSLITNYSQIANVRYVAVSIVVNVDPNRPDFVTLRSAAALRNLVTH
jgi:type II secretory pathway pseudopilin PulG